MPRSSATADPATLLRRWRHHRRISQLMLALDVGISARHLSFLENGRARPSRELLVRLARRLQLPPREANALLLSAGYAPEHDERTPPDPYLAEARAAVRLVLERMSPFPALAIDRHWTMVDANAMVAPLLAGVAPALLRPPVNVLRLALHADGLAPRILNLPATKRQLLLRLERELAATADPTLALLLDELRALAPVVTLDAAHATAPLLVSLELATDWGPLAFISTTTVFGTPADVATAELAIESFLPADAATRDALQAIAARLGAPGSIEAQT